MMKAAVLFDLDGTLVDSAPDLANATNHVLTSSGRRPVSLGEIRTMVGRGARRLIERGFAATGDPVQPERLEDHYARFIAHYDANIAAGTRPFPGVIALLDRCREENIAMGVVTNKLEGLSLKLLRELDLTRYFGAVIGADSIGVAKPDPRPYREALRRLGAENARSLMVGDSETDILTARAAGVPVVAVSFGYTDAPIATFNPDHVIDHFDALWPHVERLVGGQAAA